MKLIDSFHNEGSQDAYAFVFDTQQDGLNDMLMMGENGYRHGYWTRGPYDPDGENAHLGERVRLYELGNAVLNAFFYQLSIPQGYEELVEALVQGMESDEYGEIAGALDEDQSGSDDGDDSTMDILERLDDVRRHGWTSPSPEDE